MSQPENPCLEFFEQNAANLKKVELLWREEARIEWEAMQASKHSPGPVQHGELLVRCVISPIHIDAATGDIKPSFVSDVKDKGGSTDRLSHTSISDSVKRGEAWQAGKNQVLPQSQQRAVQGHSTVCVHAVRRLLTTAGERVFAVYDTGQIDNPAHADICQLIKEGQAARSARWDLFELTKRGYASSNP